MKTETKLDWNKLSARERDAVVAEKVMGWKWYRCEYVGRSYCPEAARIRFKFLIDPKSHDWICTEADISQAKPDQITNKWMPHFSTEIQFAWLVVERMKPLKFRITAVSDDTGYHAQFFDEFEWEGRVSLKGESAPTGDAPTAPEAICLAACRAEGVEA